MNLHNSRHIFGISDSASLFVSEEKLPVLGLKLARLAQNPNPILCYIGAARGDNPERINEFLRLAERIKVTPKILSLYDPQTSDASKFFNDVDIIFIDGGSTRNLLALFREWGVVNALRDAYNRGVILSGASAGTNIIFDWCTTDSVKTEIAPCKGLGVLKGSICVHHDVNIKRVEVFKQLLVSENAVFPAYALDDGVAVHFINEKMIEILSLLDTANLYQFSIENHKVIRTKR